MFSAKIHQQGRDRLLAACDTELLGKDLGNGFVVNKRFYGSDTLDDDEVAGLMDACTVGNLVGERVIKLAKKKKIVREGAIIVLSGTPHAQFVRML